MIAETTHIALPTRRSPIRNDVRLGQLALLFGIIFLAAEHDWSHAYQQVHFVDEEQIKIALADGTASGSLRRQLAIACFAVLGAGLWITGRSRRVRLGHPVVLCLLAYVAWCSASIAWSDWPVLTAKRVIVLYCCGLGALGLSRQLTPDRLTLVSLIVSLTYLGAGVVSELYLGGFRPWHSEYRLRGTVHPNMMGSYCAIAALAAFWLRRQLPARLVVPLLATAAMGLYLTQSRTAMGAAAAALTVSALLCCRRRSRIPVLVGSTVLVALAILCLGLSSQRFTERLIDTALLGRTEKVGSFGGRVPLWQELLSHASQHPWQGHGYGSFWLPERIEAISEHQEWSMSSAHSIYIETLLEVGLVGGLLLSVVLLGSMIAAARCACAPAQCTGQTAYRAGHGFVLALLVYGALHGLMESYYVQPMFVAVVCLTGVATVTLYQDKEPQR